MLNSNNTRHTTNARKKPNKVGDLNKGLDQF